MVKEALERGEVVLASDPYGGPKARRRPFVIVSTENYPFYPNGYLGVPLTQKNKSNTIEVHDSDKKTIIEPFEKDRSFVNPWSPVQINEWGRSLCILSEDFMDLISDITCVALGKE